MGADVTFLEALGTGKPMRRRGTLTRDVYLILAGGDKPAFYTYRIAIHDTPVTAGAGEVGAHVGIRREDYLADDWETP